MNYEQLNNKIMRTNRKNYNLYAPQHSWDTNYHLLDSDKKIEYLIDIVDVINDENDEDGYLYIKTLLNLEDIDEILSHVWKEKPYTSNTLLNLLNGTKKTLEQLFTTN